MEHCLPRSVGTYSCGCPSLKESRRRGSNRRREHPSSRNGEETVNDLGPLVLGHTNLRGQASFQATSQHTTPPAPKQQRKRHKGAGGAITQETLGNQL